MVRSGVSTPFWVTTFWIPKVLLVSQGDSGLKIKTPCIMSGLIIYWYVVFFSRGDIIKKHEICIIVGTLVHALQAHRATCEGKLWSSLKRTSVFTSATSKSHHQRDMKRCKLLHVCWNLLSIYVFSIVEILCIMFIFFKSERKSNWFTYRTRNIIIRS